MARPKGSKNKKPSKKPEKVLLKQPSFDARAELITLYKSLKNTPKNVNTKLEILRTLIFGV